MTRRFTGWHFTAIITAFFGVVIAVNLTMAVFATRTFGGVVVENSYVASQTFDRDRLAWHDRADICATLWSTGKEMRQVVSDAITASGTPGVRVDGSHRLRRPGGDALANVWAAGSVRAGVADGLGEAAEDGVVAVTRMLSATA